MQIKAEEKPMYGSMKAIYDSGIPIDFKGAMVLKALMILCIILRKSFVKLINCRVCVILYP